jgi:putative transposase
MSRICGGERLLGEREKEVLVGMLERVADFCGVRVLTFCVMSNHFHVLVFVPPSRALDDAELMRRYRVLYAENRAPDQPKPAVLEGILQENGSEAAAWRERLERRMHDVSEFMKTLKQRFSVWYNKTHDRYGTLWSDRFKSVLIEAEVSALATIAAYIDLNPIRAGLVEDPADYRWSGYGAAMGGAEPSRAGLRAVVGRSSESWSTVVANYRMVLFGKGAMPTGKAGRIDRRQALQVLSAGGRVPQAHALRCRVRYFTDGAVLGSAEFVQTWFEANRGNLSVKRPAGPKPMVGADWSGLTVYRSLRSAVFG